MTEQLTVVQYSRRFDSIRSDAFDAISSALDEFAPDLRDAIRTSTTLPGLSEAVHAFLRGAKPPQEQPKNMGSFDYERWLTWYESARAKLKEVTLPAIGHLAMKVRVIDKPDNLPVSVPSSTPVRA